MSSARTDAPQPDFQPGEAVVYPSRGVGQITALEQQEVAGVRLELFVIFFDKRKVVLRVPTAKAARQGLRRLATPAQLEQALAVLSRPARVTRAVWIRRAQEYTVKLRSGDLIALAEVVRDLHHPKGQSEASFSERELYEEAVDLITPEIAVIKGTTHAEALRLIEQRLRSGDHLDGNSMKEDVAKAAGSGARRRA